MATWDIDLTLMTRVLINDITTPQKYTNEYLQRVIIVAGIQVDSDFTFPYSYTYDISNLTISPDPITKKDAAFLALIPLKSACILTQGEFQKALGQGIKVRDGDSAIDTSVGFRGYRDILEFGPCKAYEKLKWSLDVAGVDGAGVGKAVTGPSRQLNGTSLTSISWYYDQFRFDLGGRRDRI